MNGRHVARNDSCNVSVNRRVPSRSTTNGIEQSIGMRFAAAVCCSDLTMVVSVIGPALALETMSSKGRRRRELGHGSVSAADTSGRHG